MSAPAEYPILIPCSGDELVGVVHRGAPDARRGVVIVVAGGPQYRAGAHRQFVNMARRLAGEGLTAMRFDLRGMGDSSGTHRGFEDSRPDIAAAIDALLAAEPTLQEVVLFGECESASGILFYAFRDPRVKGVVLVNPWVRTEEVRAQVYVKHYYWRRLLSGDFWNKVRRGEFRVGESLASLATMVRQSVAGAVAARRQTRTGPGADEIDHLPLPVRTAVGFERFRGAILLILSGKDLIAREFDQVIAGTAAWRGLVERPGVTREDLLEANHTFSNPVTKRQQQDVVVNWLRSW
jgi:exosortase A-associated hydrolase 1